MVAIWQWLVANGLFRDLESAGILVPLMRVMATRPLQRLENMVHEVITEAKEHADLAKVIAKVKDN